VVIRRRIKLAIGVACAGVTAYVALPTLVEHRIRSRLVERGFPEARLEVASVGLDHLQLRNVHLAEGLDLGSLVLDRGVSLLWRDVNEVSIDHANVSAAALARVAQGLPGGSGSLPFKRARIASSTLEVAGKPTRVAATAASKGNALDISIEIRDPSAGGWSAAAQGRVVVGNAKSKSKLTATGTATIDRVHVGPLELEQLTVPFSYDADGLRVSATASTYGGELALDPVVLDRSLDLVVHARGLSLAELLRPTKHMTGTGLVDGRVALRVDAMGWSLHDGELHARAPGALRVGDARALQMQSPFALQTRVANALTDFQYDALSLELAPPGADTELRLSTRGRGRRNHQELDIAIKVHGARAFATRLPGAKS
jgi:hypothetical protein